MPSDLPGTASHTPISRRALITGVGLAAGAAVIAPRLARAQSGPMAPPSTDHHPAARLRAGRCADHLLHGPGRPQRRPDVRRPGPAQQRHPAALDRRPVGGGAGLERPGALPRLERHPQQPPAPLARGQRPGQRLPPAVQQQQRQHVRLPGPPALLRAPHAPGRPLRERRVDHRARRLLRGQAPQLAERRRPPPGRELLVHRSPRTAGSSTRERPTPRAAPATRLAGSTTGSARPRRSAVRSASCRPTATASTRAGRSTSWSPRPRSPTRTGSASRPTTRSSTSRAPGRGRATPDRAARATSTCSTSGATTSSPTRSSSPTAWWTASSAGRTASAATSTATCGPPATPAARSATAASSSSIRRPS